MLNAWYGNAITDLDWYDIYAIILAYGRTDTCRARDIPQNRNRNKWLHTASWKLNNSDIKVLEKLGFKLAEEQEEYLLLISQQEYKKIKLPKVLNWDSTGYPEKNTVNMSRDQRAFKSQIEKRPQIIRI